MKKEDLTRFKKTLLARKAVLSGDVSSMSKSALTKNSESGGNLSNMPIHMADVGSDNYEQEFTLGLIQNGEKELLEINDALKRIEEGVYGLCEECDKKIPKSRLNAIPYARLCVACKKKEEEQK